MSNRHERRRAARAARRDSPLIITNEPPKHLAICVPSMDTVMADFAFSMANVVRHVCADTPDGVRQLTIHNLRGSLVASVRQACAEDALNAGATHLLWIDSDMLIPPVSAHRLLSHRRPIVGINAVVRRPPFHVSAQRSEDEYLQTTENSNGLEKAYRIGFGMVLVEAEVFRAIGIPYFDSYWQSEERKYKGEDFYFCEKAREAGFDIWVDHDLSKTVAHVANYGLTVGHGEQ